MKKVKEIDGNTYFAGICEYGSLFDFKEIPANSFPTNVVATTGTIQRLNCAINIPENCPLETYNSNSKL